MSTAIEFNNISKQYRLGLVSTKTLSHDLQRWWTMNIRRKEDPYLKIGETNDRTSKGNSEYVWALKDIDFKVEQGDVVGIIGKNGAGKSTLLKLLSRVTGPTTGTIRAKGRIGSLLEVGTGFHPEMTGRENIYLNGAILGMSKQEIGRKLDEIVDFSGCERYIDTPVKRYSSGMTVRLGFAVAAHLDPEILVVDEVLAVGDAEFQKKAIGKMQDVSKGEGRTVLFVSHNMASVSSLCKTGLVLVNGMIKYSGDIESSIEFYRKSSGIYERKNIQLNTPERAKKNAYITDFSIIDAEGRSTNCLSFNDQFCFRMQIKTNEKLSLVVRVTLFDMNETRVLALDSADIGVYYSLNKGDTITVEASTLENLNLRPGQYKVNISLRQGTFVHDHIVAVKTLEILEDDFYGLGRYHFNDMSICLKHHIWHSL